MHRFAGTILVCGVLTWTVVGCANENTRTPPLVKVSGTVKLDGKPMEGGEVRFGVAGELSKSLPIKNGAFSGEVYHGKNEIGVVWDKEGGANPTDPESTVMVNVVNAKFLPGPNSPFNAEITEQREFTLEVVSK